MTETVREMSVSALVVGEYKNDRVLLHDIFRKFAWKLYEARDRRRAMKCLEEHPVQVVLADSNLPGWNWKRALRDLRKLTHPPQLIVTSRTADDSLWAEVLNVGAYDVLAQPFERDEVERVIASARRYFDSQFMREQRALGAAAGAA